MVENVGRENFFDNFLVFDSFVYKMFFHPPVVEGGTDGSPKIFLRVGLFIVGAVVFFLVFARRSI